MRESQIAIQRDSRLVCQHGFCELTARHMKQAAGEMGASIVWVQFYGRFCCHAPLPQLLFLDLHRQ